MRKCLGEFAKDWDKDAVFAEFRGELARTISYETNQLNDHSKAKEEGKQKENIELRVLRRTRHWTDGTIVGSKMFIQETAIPFYEKTAVLKKRLSSGLDNK